MKIQSAEFALGAMTPSQFPSAGLPQIAFAGRSNVGKSSLQNALLGRKGLVKVSGTPGKTREINFFLVNQAFYFVDLPGLGYAKVSKTLRAKLGKIITKYLETAFDLRAVIYLVDIKTGGTDLDRDALAFLKEQGIATLVIGTKMDRFNQKELALALKKTHINMELPEGTILPVSSHSRKNLDQIWSQIVEAVAT